MAVAHTFSCHSYTGKGGGYGSVLICPKYSTSPNHNIPHHKRFAIGMFRPHGKLGRGSARSYEFASRYRPPPSAAFTMAALLKKALSTAPMLMYQHSRSGVSAPGK